MRTVLSQKTDRSIMIVAGEASGDLNGSAVVTLLKDAFPSLGITGVGGRLMRDAGANLLYDSSTWGVIGLADALRLAPLLQRAFRGIVSRLRRQPPDLLLLIDFPFFNTRLAAVARAAGIPVLYYFPPSSWSVSNRHADNMARITDRVATPFPWSAENLNAAGCQAEFVGHPALDWVKPSLSKKEACKLFKLDDNAYTIGLMPGSRYSEVRYNLPAMLAAADLVDAQIKGVQFVLIKAPNIPCKLLEGSLDKTAAKVTVVDRYPYDAMALCEQMLVASGTATLEAAVSGLPMTVIYKTGLLTWLQAQLFLRIPYIAMPNIIAGRRIVTELLQHDASPRRIAAEIIALMADPQKAVAIKRDLLEVVAVLGKPGANAKVADMAARMLEEAQ